MSEIKEFVDGIVGQLDKNACYLAILVGFDEEMEDTINIEVEISEGSIAGMYDTKTDDVEKARRIANSIDRELSRRSIRVFSDRDSWEEFLFESV
jgi:hypothetical protein